jgi:hypothetical protein
MGHMKESPAYWKQRAAAVRAEAASMRNPLARRGMERIAAVYEAMARNAPIMSGAQPVAPKRPRPG